jgi:hypothetical protein
MDLFGADKGESAALSLQASAGAGIQYRTYFGFATQHVCCIAIFGSIVDYVARVRRLGLFGAISLVNARNI